MKTKFSIILFLVAIYSFGQREDITTALYETYEKIQGT